VVSESEIHSLENLRGIPTELGSQFNPPGGRRRLISYYVLEPEVAGGWGKNTVFSRTPGKPVVVHKLHYQFDGWLGDELLESTPCYIASERLARGIEKAGLKGVSFDAVEVTKSEQFEELYPGRVLPKFVWLKVDGTAGQDDFGIAPGLRLVVSERAFELLKEAGLSHAASITPFET
jgi:hypothetical protein